MTATSMVRLRAAAIKMADSPIRRPFKLMVSDASLQELFWFDMFSRAGRDVPARKFNADLMPIWLIYSTCVAPVFTGATVAAHCGQGQHEHDDGLDDGRDLVDRPKTHAEQPVQPQHRHVVEVDTVGAVAWGSRMLEPSRSVEQRDDVEGLRA